MLDTVLSPTLLLLHPFGLKLPVHLVSLITSVQGLPPYHQRRTDVLNVRNILIALICVSPFVLLWDKLIVQGLLAGLVGVALAITALTLWPGETAFLVLVSRALFVAAAIPVLWVILQILPLHLLAHLIWKSAQTALQLPIAGSISVDPGASIIALGQYLTIAAVAFLSAAVAVDRLRAELTLFALSAAASVIAVLVIFSPEAWLAGMAHEQAIDCSGLGTIIAAAVCIRSVERYETRRFSSQRSKVTLTRNLIIFGAAFVICCVALALAASKQVIFATVFGLGTLAGVVIIRRFGLGSFGIGGMALLGIGIAIVVMAVQPPKRGTSVTLAFASDSSSATALSQRMLDDASSVGTGAGTFAALAPIYREMGDPPSGSVASTAAGTLAIELGSPMLWLIAAAAVASIVVLLRTSLQRGRDSFLSGNGGRRSDHAPALSFCQCWLTRKRDRPDCSGGNRSGFRPKQKSQRACLIARAGHWPLQRVLQANGARNTGVCGVAIRAERIGVSIVSASSRHRSGPGIPLQEQSPHDLVWIRDDFLFYEEDFGKVVVYVVRRLMDQFIRPNRINIDTGA